MPPQPPPGFVLDQPPQGRQEMPQPPPGFVLEGQASRPVPIPEMIVPQTGDTMVRNQEPGTRPGQAITSAIGQALTGGAGKRHAEEIATGAPPGVKEEALREGGRITGDIVMGTLGGAAGGVAGRMVGGLARAAGRGFMSRNAVRRLVGELPETPVTKNFLSGLWDEVIEPLGLRAVASASLGDILPEITPGEDIFPEYLEPFAGLIVGMTAIPPAMREVLVRAPKFRHWALGSARRGLAAKLGIGLGAAAGVGLSETGSFIARELGELADVAADATGETADAVRDFMSGYLAWASEEMAGAPVDKPEQPDTRSVRGPQL